MKSLATCFCARQIRATLVLRVVHVDPQFVNHGRFRNYPNKQR
jgi:hypothetical protein